MAKAFRHVDLVIHVDHAVIDLDVCIVEIERGARKVLAYACSAAVLRVLLRLLTACLPRRLEVVAMPLAFHSLRLLIQLEALGDLAAAGFPEADGDLEAGLVELREHDSLMIFSGRLFHCQLTASCDESGQL